MISNRPGWPLRNAQGKPFYKAKLERESFVSLLAYVLLALDRSSDDRHLMSRAASGRPKDKRAALTESAPPGAGAGRLDSPPEPLPAPCQAVTL